MCIKCDARVDHDLLTISNMVTQELNRRNSNYDIHAEIIKAPPCVKITCSSCTDLNKLAMEKERQAMTKRSTRSSLSMTTLERDARNLAAIDATIALHDNFLTRRHHVKEAAIKVTRELIMLHGGRSPPLNHPGWMFTLDDIDISLGQHIDRNRLIDATRDLLQHTKAKERYDQVVVTTTGWDGQRYNESTIIETKRRIQLMGGALPEEPIYPRDHGYGDDSSDSDSNSDANDEDRGGEGNDDHHP